MELSREIYQLIIQNVSSRSDLLSLTHVSKPLRRAAERALYNTLYMKDPATTVKLCITISSTPRVATLVDALTVFSTTDEVSFHPDTEDEEQFDDEETNSLPENYWDCLASALRQATQLRFFNLHIDGDNDKSWILRDAPFRLRSFHCDLAWDADLVTFLNTQDRMTDLYLADYAVSSRPPEDTASEEQSAKEEDGMRRRSGSPTSVLPLDPDALPALSMLECSFIDAVAAIAPRRPLRRVKTCFSREDTPGKTDELQRLYAGLRNATARVRSLDLADAAYAEDFSLTVLGALVPRFPELRYLGTLVLPVGLEVRRPFPIAFFFLCSRAHRP